MHEPHRVLAAWQCRLFWLCIGLNSNGIEGHNSREKRLLVDDEKNTLDQLTEFPNWCKIDTSSSFEEGKALFETEKYDAVVIDIMGVRGFDLLRIATQLNIAAVILTAHSLSEENLMYTIENGACYFLLKERMGYIDLFLADVLEAV